MSDVNSGPDGAETHDHNNDGPGAVDKPDGAQGAQPDDESAGDTFPRDYVESLRKESAGYRDRAKQAEGQVETLSRRLHTELVKATKRLENPADLPYDAKHLDDADTLAAALDALLADRPYLAKRAVRGDAGQGVRGGAQPPSLLDALKGTI
ncbi:hypothetical protein [Mycolicibacterium palauense]|uniref:hypothetical protein n=1 Tax=Mycolicibacterium palauense TaxID=2034511 RepID=UPI000BFF05AC|nr:hypothetical protein [Mycolicibacterium palauense]